MSMSLRAYARHRGVALSAVQKAIASGRIHPEPDGRIDPTLQLLTSQGVGHTNFEGWHGLRSPGGGRR